MKLKALVIAAAAVLFVQTAAFAQAKNADTEYNALAEQVYAFVGADDYAAAIPLLKRMHDLKPGELWPVEYLGTLYLNLPEERPALTNAAFWLSEAEKRGSYDDTVYYNLACLYSLRKDTEKSTVAVNKALALGFSGFEEISNDDDLAHFRTGSWWKGIAKNSALIEQQLELFNEFVSEESEKSDADRITFYNGIIAALKKLAPNIPALQCQPLFSLASSYEDTGGYAKAASCYLELKSVLEKLFGKEHPHYAISLKELGGLYYRAGDYAKAESYYLEAAAILRKVFGKEHLFNVTTLNGIGLLYKDMGNYAKAESYYMESKAIREKVYGKEHQEYAESLNDLGELYYSKGDYAKAESFFLETRAIWEKTLGKEHPDYAVSLNNLGALYVDMGNYAKAENFYLESKTIREKALGKEHPDYASSLSNLGILYGNMGNYAKAESCYLEARTIQEKTLGKEHPDYALSLNNMGVLYKEMGSYANAERYYLEAKTIQEKTIGKEHPDYAISVSNLGILYRSMGEYAKAESCYLESKAIREKALGKGHPDYATSLINMGELYRNIGDYTKAETSHLEAKTILEKALGKEHPDYATLLNNMGALYTDMGNYAKVESCYLEARAIREKILGKEHPDYVSSLANLGTLYYKMKDYSKAESYFLEARAIREKILGKGHPDYAVSLNNLGALYDSKGDYAKAESSYLESRAIREKVFGKEHPDYASSLGNLYTLYLATREFNKALPLKQEQNKLEASLVNRNFSFLSEQQRDAYWNANSPTFELSYSLSFYHPVPASNILNYDNALFSKGLLLRTTNAVRDSIYASGNKTLISQFEELSRIRQQISALQQGGGNEAYVKSLETQAETLDKSLTRSSAAFKEFQADLAVNWQSVRSGLKAKEAAIEFVSFEIYDKKWTDKTQYAALVVKPGMNAPVWVPLCEESALTALFDEVSGWGDPKYEALLFYDENGLALYNAVWQPLEKILEGVTAVYYSPSGMLHKISFNAIPVKGNTDVRLTDIYDLNLVSSTREVANRKTKTAGKPNSAVVYGGLEYNVDAATMRNEALAYNKPETEIRAGAALPAGGTRGGSWNFLGGSLNESRDVQSLLEGKQVRVIRYSGAKGNKESFKDLSGKKMAIIHLATHGFFLEDIKKDYEKLERLGGGQKAHENQLLRSGLILAGGNNAWSGKAVEGVENGILFADDVAKMNLLGTELVALSACVTALGKVNNSEGVFGLQRAFKLAGAQTLVMSLWEVDDKGTALIMGEFYRNWLSGMSKQEAFKKAQQTLRKTPGFVQPYYWAAFVMMD